MDELPSYQASTGRKDWLELVAPHVHVRDYHNLCLVSERFYSHFAWRLFKDPVRVIRALGIPPASHPRFLERIEHAIMGESYEVAIMDCRGFCLSPDELVAGKYNTRIALSIREFPAHFPGLRCLLLDGHSNVDLSRLATRAMTVRSPDAFADLHLFSIRHCHVPLQPDFFDEGWLKALTCLDLSFTSGSMRSLLGSQGSFNRRNLPYLSVLKTQGKGLDATRLGSILEEFGRSLWSLDVSDNDLIRDDFLSHFIRCACFPSMDTKLQTDAHFGVEGKIRRLGMRDSFCFVDESHWSSTFSHPNRYLADTPGYTTEVRDTDGNLLTRLLARSNGREAVRGDSADDTIQVLAGGADEKPLGVPRFGLWPPHHARITHLHLNGLNLSSEAVQELLLLSPGFVEHFECDRAILRLGGRSSSRPWMDKAPFPFNTAVLYGLPGAAYLFRPVFSSNLRVLKIHHSIITNTPTLVSHDISPLASYWLAETCIRERLDLAHPQTFVPDMNPRLYSMTISKIPRYSTGVVTERLIEFLRLAAIQEQGIEETKAALPRGRHAPLVLRGLRHITLEFEPEPTDELISLEGDGDDDDVDPAGMMNQKMEAFSFFSESAWGPSSSPVSSGGANETEPDCVPAASAAAAAAAAAAATTGPPAYQYVPGDAGSGTHAHASSPDDMRGRYPWSSPRFSGGYLHQQDSARVAVWVGPGIKSASAPAVNEYMDNLADAGSEWHEDPRFMPATPSHVAAGVPPGSYIFTYAWEAMMVPPAPRLRLRLRLPARAELRAMRDVVGDIKAWRLRTRAEYASVTRMAGSPTMTTTTTTTTTGVTGGGAGEHEYWKGKLDLVLQQQHDG